MIAFPNIKINLGLSITEKRPDGYHNLETVFYPVALEDALEIRTSPNADRKFTLHQHGMEIAGNPEDNLVVKAYLLMDKEFHLPPIEIHLYKHIPSGAGLGGGSSDAAFMLKLLNDHYQLGVSEEQLEVYAATLGADCAFFIRNAPTFAEGIGNIFSPIPLSLKGYQKQTDICRGNWKHLLPGRTFIKRLPNHDYKTECFCFHPGSLFKHSSPSSEISG